MDKSHKTTSGILGLFGSEGSRIGSSSAELSAIWEETCLVEIFAGRTRSATLLEPSPNRTRNWRVGEAGGFTKGLVTVGLCVWTLSSGWKALLQLLPEGVQIVFYF